MPLILAGLSVDEVGGMRGVAVECIDITQNSDCEGKLTKVQLTLKHESVGIKQD